MARFDSKVVKLKVMWNMISIKYICSVKVKRIHLRDHLYNT